jgi:uncharacterized membrane protein YhaH (DUF805 family)
MSFFDAVSSGFRNCLNFRGRASRHEYWWFVLFSVLVGMALSLLSSVAAGMVPVSFFVLLNGIVSLGLSLPSSLAAVRRLHDTNRTGWWLLGPVLGSALLLGGYWQITAYSVMVFDPATGVWDKQTTFEGGSAWTTGLMVCGLLIILVTVIINLVFLLQRGDDASNRFGPPPSTVARQSPR